MPVTSAHKMDAFNATEMHAFAGSKTFGLGRSIQKQQMCSMCIRKIKIFILLHQLVLYTIRKYKLRYFMQLNYSVRRNN